MEVKQKTIQQQVELTGTGLHTGKPVHLVFKPAPIHYGYRFKRTDLPDQPEIEAIVENVKDTSRGTTLIKDNVRIATIEHCIAAIFALDIDNILIELDAEEVPILDGSAKLFVEALEKAQICEQEAARKMYVLTKPVAYADAETGIEYLAIPAPELRFSVMTDYNSPVLNTQNAVLNHISDFKQEIAPCKTFCFVDELQQLIKFNLVKGGDLDNAIVFVNKILPQEEVAELQKFFNKPHISVDKTGILNNCELIFFNEPTRHKLLDVVGDLALIGKRFNAHIIATKPGHKNNALFAKKLKDHFEDEEKQLLIPTYDPKATPLFDINEIQKKLPHRPPFLLVDKIMEMTDTYIIGVKNVTMNEPFFVGHFPGRPVMPGVLQIEAMAQCGGVLILSTVPDPENYITYFLKIDNVRFRAKVEPGDTLVFRLELMSPIRRGLCQMSGKGYVGGKLVIEAEMLAQVVKER
ncbi:MAG: bifunctional UDP-3-O-[3-hydroxymyristoyl] N-acetylglucosamine deacetylase/3-hydroxyacyl-ACP dehydratase [Bacteroidales bacterium]|nr:bifunctional UDP-3-O-[3-hydroxymyristoyl] N-acetylglucosamine deacetylase/3-hydroxyacyl-ACP dehydratase [Bacteroidales bacterium]